MKLHPNFNALKTGFEVRRCVENDFAYDTGMLPDLRSGKGRGTEIQREENDE